MPDDEAPADSPATTLGFSRGDRAFVHLVGAVLGGAAGAGLPYVAEAVGKLDRIPFSGLLHSIGAYDADWASIGRPLIGLLVGLALAAVIVHNSPVVRIDTTSVHITQRGSTRRVERHTVNGVYLDGAKTVMVNASGRELFRGEIEGGRDKVRAAFTQHGYPWESV